jgi:hypothetical protein
MRTVAAYFRRCEKHKQSDFIGKIRQIARGMIRLVQGEPRVAARLRRNE